jgi:tripartite-type tricarboxylate transporter receptor subunit TctC
MNRARRGGRQPALQSAKGGNMKRILIVLAAAFASFAVTAAACADPIADFYRSRQIVLIIGGGPGDGYDTYGRLLARHMANHIPGNPNIVVQNEPGAGSLTAVNNIYNVAPKDGTVFATAQRFITIMPLLGMGGVRFDANKLSYIGSMGKETTICYAWAGSGFSKLEDMKTRQMITGTMGRGTELTNFTQTLSRTLGLKIKVVAGYDSSAQINLAVERGELQGRCGVSFDSIQLTHQDWIDQKKIDVLVQIGLSRIPELKDTPFLIDLIKDPKDKEAVELLLAPTEASRPFFAPPGVPEDRLRALRAAFDATMTDPDFLADAKKTRLQISPVSGGDVADLVARIYASSPAAIARARDLARDQ